MKKFIMQELINIKMRKTLVSLVLLIAVHIVSAQFAPPVGQPGTTAISKDSSVFLNWASACSVNRGYQDISDTTLGFASVGDSSLATGPAGINGVVSLGDGGAAIIHCPFTIKNGPGFDFAVFENSFSDDYLELAFVEVSSDGINFFRFPATSNTQDTVQVGPFDLLNATKLNNLAGKYRANYGTPFDLQELSGVNGLDITNVTHVKIIDVVGSISEFYSSTELNGKKVNDPWPTPFPSSGFDLDAVGVIHQNSQIGFAEPNIDMPAFNCFVNESSLHITGVSPENLNGTFYLYDVSGRMVKSEQFKFSRNEIFNLNFSVDVQKGIYFVVVESEKGARTKKIII